MTTRSAHRRFFLSASRYQVTTAWRAAFVLLAVAGWTGRAQAQSQTTAMPATGFLNSTGVCVHMAQGVDDPVQVASALSYLGIRNIRENGTTDPNVITDYLNVHSATGAKFCLLPVNGDIASSISLYEQMADAGALLAVEGPNEVNNYSVTYDGATSSYSGSYLPAAEFTADLYSAVRDDSVLNGIPVFAPSEAGGSEPLESGSNVGFQFLTIPGGSDLLMPDGTTYGDVANVHNYLNNGQFSQPNPNVSVEIENHAWLAEDPIGLTYFDSLQSEYTNTFRNHFAGIPVTQLRALPRVTTETGWKTQGGQSITEDAQGKVYMNVYLDGYKRGWAYTFIYMLRDDPVQGYWGMLHTDYSDKLSGLYLHNLTSVLADTSAIATPGTLNYSIPGEPDTVHDLLLEKSDGTFELVVWDEHASSTASDNVVVSLGGTSSTVNVYDTTLGTAPVQTLSGVSIVPLTLSDHPMIIELPATAVYTPGAPPAAPALTDADVGNPALAGSAVLASGVYTVTGGGADIWDPFDQFNFDSESITGDATMIVHVDTQQNTNVWAKAGLMFRNSASTTSANVAVVQTPGEGINIQWRDTDGGPSNFAGQINSGVTANWLKLVKYGNTFAAYYATSTGAPGESDWEIVGTHTTPFTNSTYLGGLAVTAHDNTKASTAAFSGLSILSTGALGTGTGTGTGTSTGTGTGTGTSTGTGTGTGSSTGTGTGTGTTTGTGTGTGTTTGTGTGTSTGTGTGTGTTTGTGTGTGTTTGTGTGTGTSTGTGTGTGTSTGTGTGTGTTTGTGTGTGTTTGTGTGTTTGTGTGTGTSTGTGTGTGTTTGTGTGTGTTTGTGTGTGTSTGTGTGTGTTTGTGTGTGTSTGTGTGTGTSTGTAPTLSDGDIGNPGLAGSASVSSGIYTQKGGGADIWNNYDQFNYQSESLTTDATIIVHVDSQQNTNVWAKAGPMFRNSLAGGAAFVSLFQNPGSLLELMWRDSDNGFANFTSQVKSTAAANWLELVKTGNTFTAYYATTTGAPGVSDWILVGTHTTSFTNASYAAGLAVTAHDNTQICTVVFSNLSILGGTGTGTGTSTGTGTGTGTSTGTGTGTGTGTSTGTGTGTGTSTGTGTATGTTTGTGTGTGTTTGTGTGTGTSTGTGTGTGTSTGTGTGTGTTTGTGTGTGTSTGTGTGTGTSTGTGTGTGTTTGTGTGTGTSTGTGTGTSTGTGTGTGTTTGTGTGTGTTTGTGTGTGTSTGTGTGTGTTTGTGTGTGTSTGTGTGTGTSTGTAPTLSDGDIGNPGLAGSASVSSGIYTQKGGGADIWNNYDQFNYQSESLTTDATIIVHVDSQQNTNVWAKAGPMFRNSLAGGAAFVSLFQNPGSLLELMWRDSDNGFANFTSQVKSTAAANWLELVKTGNTFTAYYATTTGAPGVSDWILVGTHTTSFTNASYAAGLAVTAHDNTQICTVVFSNLSILGGTGTGTGTGTSTGTGTGTGTTTGTGTGTGTSTGTGTGTGTTTGTGTGTGTTTGTGTGTGTSTGTGTGTSTGTGTGTGTTTGTGTGTGTSTGTGTGTGTTTGTGTGTGTSTGTGTGTSTGTGTGTGTTTGTGTGTGTSTGTGTGTGTSTGTGTGTGTSTGTGTGTGTTTGTGTGTGTSTGTGTGTGTSTGTAPTLSDGDIGNPGLAGSASVSSGIYTQKGGGADIWNNYDQFNYQSESLTTDATIIVHVDSQQNTNVWAKAGPMFRNSLAGGAAFVSLFQNPGSLLELMWRDSDNGFANFTSQVKSTAAANWLELVKTGNTFTAYYATTTGAPGVSDWILVGTHTTSFTNASYAAGLAVTAHDNTQICTVVFSNLSILGGTGTGTGTSTGTGTGTGTTTGTGTGTGTSTGTGTGTGTSTGTGTGTTTGTGTGTGTTTGTGTGTGTSTGTGTGTGTTTGTGTGTGTSTGTGTGTGTTTGTGTGTGTSTGTGTGTGTSTGTGTGTGTTTGTGTGTGTSTGTGTGTGTSTGTGTGTGTSTGTAPALTDADIGGPAYAGSASVSSGIYTQKGGGADIWNNYDQFNYDSAPISTDMTMIVHVDSQQNTNVWAKAGLMFRNSLAGGAAFVSLLQNPGGLVELQWRDTDNAYANTTNQVTSGAAATWLELIKVGSTFTAYYATTTGLPKTTDWILVATHSTTFTNSTYYEGLADTAHDNTQLSTAVFSNLTVQASTH